MEKGKESRKVVLSLFSELRTRIKEDKIFHLNFLAFQELFNQFEKFESCFDKTSWRICPKIT